MIAAATLIGVSLRSAAISSGLQGGGQELESDRRLIADIDTDHEAGPSYYSRSTAVSPALLIGTSAQLMLGFSISG